MREITVQTRLQAELVDITRQVARLVEGTKRGSIVLFCPHTTAGLTINECADPAVARDIIYGLDRIVPARGGYTHTEGNAAAHIKASMMGSHRMVFIEHGQLIVGRWQGIFLCEFDGPRSRTVWACIQSVAG